MTNGKEKFPTELQEKAPIEPKYTPEDYEAAGRGLLKDDPDLARAYLRASHLSKTEINSLVEEAKKTTTVKEKKPMDPEEKKKMFEKMAEDLEKKAEKAEETEKEAEKTGEKIWKEKKNKEKNLYKSLAKTYRRKLKEIEELEKSKQGS